MISKDRIFDEGQGPRPRLRLRVPPDARFARTVRDGLIGFAKLHEIPGQELESLLFAVGEALANAIEHSSSSAEIEVLFSIDDREIVATVIDSGSGLIETPPGVAPLPSVLDERGRGIPIMQRCTDIFAVDALPGRGTVVTLGRYRRDAQPQNPSAS